MPLVIAVAFFVAFHILNISGEKLAKAESVPAWLGMWMSSIALLPVAFVLIKAARNDSRIFTADWYKKMYRAIADRVNKKRAIAKPEQIG
jgi:lipopolysaccharide export system permease protein